MPVVLFDLDDTLVATKTLREIRDTANYAALTPEALAGTALYRPVRRMLETMQSKKIQLGVVSNAGRQYVERVLEHHKLCEFFTTVVTYTDVGAKGKKPKPDGILLALQQLKVAATPDVLFVGDHATDIEAAYKANITPVVPSWATRTPVNLAPALEMPSSVLINYFDSPKEYCLFAERAASQNSYNFERKAVYFLPLDLNANVITHRPEMRIFCLGRYFSQKTPITAKLHDGHALSLEIAKKNEPKEFKAPVHWPQLLAHVITKGPAWLYNGEHDFDLITVIPAKSGKQKRMESLLVDVAKICAQQKSADAFDAGVFRFTEGARDQKTLGRAERVLEASRVLKLNGSVKVKGKRVLVIDDVVTTGSTMARALDLLVTAGAIDARGVAIAKTVSLPDLERYCPKCGGSLDIRKNRTTDERFWGCSNFRNPAAKCEYTEPMNAKECPQCERPMRVQMNRYTKEKFWGCTGYREEPACHYTEKYR